MEELINNIITLEKYIRQPFELIVADNSEKNLNNDKILVGVSTVAFMANPEYLISNGVFQNEYLYKEYKWVNLEQLFWHAIKDLNFFHWPEMPLSGYDTNKQGQYPYQARFKKVYNPIFETTADFKAVPYIDITPLIESPDIM